MKVIDEKGKLFGKINLIDLIVLLAVVIAAVGVGYKFLKSNDSIPADQAVPLTYTCRLRNAPAYLADQYTAHEFPLNLVSGTAYLAGGKLLSVEVVPTKVSVTDSAGKVSSAEDPNNVDVIFTCQVSVDPASPIFKAGTQELRVGTGHTVKTQFFEASTIIQTLSLEDKAE